MHTIKGERNLKMSVVNFNQKQWRQDFAAYVQDKLGWTSSRVTKSKVIKKAYYDNSLGEHITSLKEFRVINGSGNEVKIQYYHDCVVGEEGMFYIERDFNLVYEYLKEAEKEPLWLLMSDFFYKNRCNSGLISHDKDYYAFRKKSKLYRIYRKNDNKFKLEIEEVHLFEYVDLKIIDNLNSIEELESTILQYF